MRTAERSTRIATSLRSRKIKLEQASKDGQEHFCYGEILKNSREVRCFSVTHVSRCVVGARLFASAVLSFWDFENCKLEASEETHCMIRWSFGPQTAWVEGSHGQRDFTGNLVRDVLHVGRDVPLVPERVLDSSVAVAVGLVGRFLE